ncbi:MAG: ABC transporter permease, partial [Actinobacteria bacterium]|nr:ABC transporter permease [Actinomycetota bacterium]NIS31110.1 ABC transporter permease [Actinomycetota bacterium]NIT95481.1 ABC transporter permease [Actinomycetota bacterium]NIU19171.1 ABC transporter permease [Actinomycetota bacterium]NIU66262.1 ABC transporter permease [Actinomycetota bacterium]
MADLALLARHVRTQNRFFWRVPIGAFFTLVLPVIMLVLFVALF